MKLIALVAIALLQATPVSLDSIRQAYQARQYADVIKMAGQMWPSLNRSGTVADKAELLEMKGEAHLQQRQWPQASEAYTQAGTLAADEKIAAINRATGTLIKRSTGGKYTPKQPSTNPAIAGKQPIDILDLKQRDAAFAALYNDDSKTLTAKSVQLSKATALPALMNGLKQLADIRYLELAATGNDTEYQSATGGIVDHAAGLMSDALKKMQTQVQTISQMANAQSQPQTPGQNIGQVLIGSKRGLFSSDKNTLNEIINTANQITQACQEFGKAAGKTSAFDAPQKEAAALAKQASDVLNADYSSNVSPYAPPGGMQNPGSVTIPGAGTNAPGGRPRR